MLLATAIYEETMGVASDMVCRIQDLCASCHRLALYQNSNCARTEAIRMVPAVTFGRRDDREGEEVMDGNEARKCVARS